MNAQEAMEIKQKELEFLEEQREEMISDPWAWYATEEDFNENLDRITKDIKALSIVLESAKKLHEGSLIRKFKDDNGLPMIHILHGNSYDKAEAEIIGIEVEE
ncbi:hypothetical protein BKP56_09185 [Marinilactibacillus sp. 15R]|uniref:hypothetical protein n=1 Tax=Marinilactibacillus sp. 15R TaxID=1911586 RepID=UPI00090AB3A9|nr:hypothetical protein [Marinilactibacillus sp. 15R]API89417.1 hypothetical protein BKP56_09185 [Marinilactibacillus sp. 15R]